MRRLAQLVLLSVVVLPASASAEAGTPDLDALLAAFAAMPGLEANFREEKHITLLAVPLVSQGTLHFAPPGRFARVTTSPLRSSVVVADGVLRFADDSGSDQIDLQSSPAVRAVVESFLAIFSGDRARLEQAYRLAVAPRGEDGWELTLTPRAAELRRVITRVVVRGRGIILEQMRIAEGTGDETVTTFTNVDPARRYDPAESRRIFGASSAR